MKYEIAIPYKNIHIIDCLTVSFLYRVVYSFSTSFQQFPIICINFDRCLFIKVAFSLSDFLCGTPKSALVIYNVSGVTLN